MYKTSGISLTLVCFDMSILCWAGMQYVMNAVPKSVFFTLSQLECYYR